MVLTPPTSLLSTVSVDTTSSIVALPAHSCQVCVSGSGWHSSQKDRRGSSSMAFPGKHEVPLSLLRELLRFVSQGSRGVPQPPLHPREAPRPAFALHSSVGEETSGKDIGNGCQAKPSGE